VLRVFCVIAEEDISTPFTGPMDVEGGKGRRDGGSRGK